jgi:hypothetical protein
MQLFIGNSSVVLQNLLLADGVVFHNVLRPMFQESEVVPSALGDLYSEKSTEHNFQYAKKQAEISLELILLHQYTSEVLLGDLQAEHAL